MSSWQGKLLGLGLGWIMKGPVGAILGGLLGAVYDDADLLDKKINETDERAVYHAYLVTLFVYIAKADGTISPVEIRIIRDFFQRKGISSEEMEHIREALKIASRQQNVNIKSIVDQINELFDYTTRYNILELCYHIAAADRVISNTEQDRLEELGNLMRVSKSDQYGLQFEYGFTKKSSRSENKSNTKENHKGQTIDDELERLKREMRGEKSSNDRFKEQKKERKEQQKPPKRKTAWEILGVTKGTSAKEVKKAYLKLAAENHPDKFSSPKEKAIAEEKIKDINLAYQELKRYFGN